MGHGSRKSKYLNILHESLFLHLQFNHFNHSSSLVELHIWRRFGFYLIKF